MRASILDLGSNSFRLLVADVEADGAIQPVLRAREFLRLGRQVALSGSFTDDAIKRAVGAAEHLAGLGMRAGAEKSMALATSAIRDAANREELVERLQAATGIPVSVIDGREEARLGFLGVASSIALPAGNHLVLDIGGGSLELAVGSGATPIWTGSTDLGVSRLVAECVTSDPLTADDVARLQDRVQARLGAMVPEVRALDPEWCVSVGGPNRALLRMAIGEASSWQPATLNQAWMTAHQLEALRDRLIAMSLAERRAVPGMKASRAGQIAAASVIITAVHDLLGVDKTVASYWGLREGAILDAYGNAGLAFGRELRPASVSRMERRFSPLGAHDAHVATLASSLFDQLAELHHMGSIAKELLVYAARLHTIGTGVGFRGYHRHGAYLIENFALRGFSPTEIAALASIVRFGRSGITRPGYPPFESLNDDWQRQVRQIVALLHVADTADRGLDQLVESIAISVTDDHVAAMLLGIDPELRREWVESAETSFLQVFGRPLVFEGVKVIDSF